MDDLYAPASTFLAEVANGEVPLSGSISADNNLRRLISFMTDADTSNRDWATFILANQDLDTPEVRRALLMAAEDEDATVRGEALAGLARRDPALATPLVAQELTSNECGYGTFEAAHHIGAPSLLGGLLKWRGRGSASWINDEIEVAIRACEPKRDPG